MCATARSVVPGAENVQTFPRPMQPEVTVVIPFLDEEGTLQLRNLDSSAQTLLNGEAIDQALLASGDEIRIANCRWVLQAPGLRPEKVLTTEAVRAKRSHLPWLIVTALLASAALAWSRGWLPF